MGHFRGTLLPLLGVSMALALGAVSCAPSPEPRSQDKLSVALVSLTSPVSPGNVASITVKTAPSAERAIVVTYKSGPSRAQGLDPKTANHDGIVSWAWIVGTQTTPGEWPVTVTCSTGSRQSTLETSFVVQ